MCGIAGFIDFTKKSDKNLLVKMTDTLYHRGPDDKGYSFYSFEKCNIGLGHRRLSILDLTFNGHQPMSFDNLEIVYNGEVYNFKEIRKELESYGYKFKSNSDTEVILKAYHKWGIDAVSKFNGMFAIAIYDKKNQKLTLIRDRTGVKPLYYYYKNGLFMFASELKAFHQNPYFKKELDINVLAQYFQYGYILEPYSIFKNTYKLKAGHYLEFDIKNKKLNIKKYWDVIDYYNQPKLKISEKEAIEETEKLLKSAFSYRMIADVDVGLFLSGGYDSTVVAAILQSNMSKKLKTFTIGFKEKEYNEAPYAKKIAEYLGTDHTEYYCTQKDALEILPQLPHIYDEPFGDSSAIPTILVSKLARKKVKVSLSADGGDEIFGGYNKYLAVLNYFNKVSKIPLLLRNLIAFLLNCINPTFIPYVDKIFNFESRYFKLKNILKAKDIIEILKYTSQHFTYEELKNIFLKEIKNLPSNFDLKINSDNISKMLAIDYKTYLPDDILVKVDRATMSVSLEGREPFLDHRIVEFVSRLPSEYKIRNGEKKWLLKQIAYKYLPKSLIDRPKKGFSVPIFRWLKKELKEYLTYYLSERRLKENGILDYKKVIKLRDQYLNGKKIDIHKLWFLLIFEMWREKWL